ncbi:ABC transporter substrate-binding protein [Thermospira aquatica]|uniref:ABC transporter substrate-binding protein n=1 Tax=Thermospira aquatica TaxID=2828656 RepID=A0AAX3BFY7_9SPIR|nr:ABC transporter substrate-binding protein [Thermospira aquatica]URA11237.1 ABC transporter substrate-binding protein [Thermospira aquatica]
MMKKILWTAVVCVLFLGCARPMRVMIVGDFSGVSSMLHVEGREGILWAISDLRDEKKILYEMLDIHNISDDEVKKVLQKYRPDVILGPFESTIGARLIPLANEMAIPIICPTVSTSCWTGKRDYMARVVPENLQEIRSLLCRMERDGVSRPLLLYAEANKVYATAWKEESSNFWTSKGVNVVIVPYRFEGSGWVEEVAERVVRARPDALIIVAGGEEGGLLVQRIGRQLSGVRFYLSGWTMDRYFLRWSGRYGEGAVVIHHFVMNHTNQGYQNIARRFLEQYGQMPSFGFVYGYEAMKLAAELYDDAKGQLAKRWFSLFPRTFEGLQSAVYLDQYGDATRKMFIIKVVSNEWQVANE